MAPALEPKVEPARDKEWVESRERMFLKGRWGQCYWKQRHGCQQGKNTDDPPPGNKSNYFVFTK